MSAAEPELTRVNCLKLILEGQLQMIAIDHVDGRSMSHG
jgi:hypothetical protein